MKWITTKDIAEMLNCSMSQFYKYIQHDQKFPKPIKRHAKARAKLWAKDDIEKYLKQISRA